MKPQGNWDRDYNFEILISSVIRSISLADGRKFEIDTPRILITSVLTFFYLIGNIYFMVYITFIHHSHYIYVDKIKRKTKKMKRTFWTNILISYKLFRDKQDWYLQCLQIQFSLQLIDGTYIQASLQILLSCSGIFTILVPKNRKLCDAFELSYIWYRIIIERNQIWKIVLSQTSPFSLLKKYHVRHLHYCLRENCLQLYCMDLLQLWEGNNNTSILSEYSAIKSHPIKKETSIWILLVKRRGKKEGGKYIVKVAESIREHPDSWPRVFLLLLVFLCITHATCTFSTAANIAGYFSRRPDPTI